MAVSISRVSFEHHRSALGIAETQPRISWRFDGDVSDWEQSAYDVEVVRGSSAAPRVFSFNSSSSLYLPWPDSPLDEAESASVRVRAQGIHNQSQPATPWSDWVAVETGISKKWEAAKPITSLLTSDKDKPKRPIYFRKEFHLPPDSVSARLYVTALGIYEVEINGERVGDRVLAPGWQSYHHRHVYDTYDVTDLLKSGRNAIGAVVGEGWYSGRLGFGGGHRNLYGDSIGFLGQLIVMLANSTTMAVPTDETWQSSYGPVVSGEIYDGEEYDARLSRSIENFSTWQFNSSSWNGTRALPALKGELVSPDQPPVRRIQKILPQEIFKSPSGKVLVDFGQNLVGWLQIKVDGPANTTIRLRHAEVLEEGELGIRPLRKAKAQDVIHLSGDGPLEWEPKFTFHGFRYAQVDGWPDETPLDGSSIAAVMVHTDMEQTGWFECSHELLNKLHSNVRWSMRGNFVSIPTDCPQRDERLGWTGDAHAFGPTSNYLFDTAGFWKSWHKDVWAEMSSNGTMVPNVYVPRTPSEFPDGPTAVWGDVTVGNPWNLFTSFGDRKLLGEHMPQAQGWIDVGIPRSDTGLWNRTTFQIADWLDPLAPPGSPWASTTAGHLVADAYLVRMTQVLSDIAKALERNDLAEQYQRQHADLKRGFKTAWAPDGSLVNRTQTAYALALYFDLLSDPGDKEAAVTTLRNLVKENNFLIGTGFAGTHIIGHALHDINATDDFYQMLLQTRNPSWLYQVKQGGTTTWERWDSMLPNGTINPGEMTSFNHYSFGSVADWMHRVIGGISPAEPGYKMIDISPVPGGGISHANAKLISPYGEIYTGWWVDETGFHLKVKVPPNTKARVTLPGARKSEIVGSGWHEF